MLLALIFRSLVWLDLPPVPFRAPEPPVRFMSGKEAMFLRVASPKRRR